MSSLLCFEHFAAARATADALGVPPSHYAVSIQPCECNSEIVWVARVVKVFNLYMVLRHFLWCLSYNHRLTISCCSSPAHFSWSGCVSIVIWSHRWQTGSLLACEYMPVYPRTYPPTCTASIPGAVSGQGHLCQCTPVACHTCMPVARSSHL